MDPSIYAVGGVSPGYLWSPEGDDLLIGVKGTVEAVHSSDSKLNFEGCARMDLLNRLETHQTAEGSRDSFYKALMRPGSFSGLEHRLLLGWGQT